MKKFASVLIICTLILGIFPTVQANEYMNVYSLDGRVEVIRTADFNAWHAVGWYSAPVMYVYALDGRCELILKSDFSKWQAVGWYSAPVMTVYAVDGRREIISKSDYDAWNSVGWCSDTPIMVYAPDGRSRYIPKNEFPQWQESGWYSKPVMYVYAKDGRKQLILKSDFSKWKAVGWYSIADRITGWWFFDPQDELMSHFSENVHFGADGTFQLTTWREKLIGTYTIQGNKIIAKYDFYYMFAGSTIYELVSDMSGEIVYEFNGLQIRDRGKYFDKKNGYTRV